MWPVLQRQRKCLQPLFESIGVHTSVAGTSGTDADLRRLGHKRAGELLMAKFNMSADEVNSLPRWDRIDVIRRQVLANCTKLPWLRSSVCGRLSTGEGSCTVSTAVAHPCLLPAAGMCVTQSGRQWSVLTLSCSSLCAM